jgi:rhodanese-related sulfurtransferase
VIEGDPMIPEDRISIEELKARLEAGAKVLVIDVRAADGWEAAKTKIKGALRVPYEKLEEQMKGWEKTQEIVAYCA